MITQLNDKTCIYEHLRKDRSLFAYHIGDLDPFFFPNCIWYGLVENYTLVEVVLVYHGLSTPTVLALSVTPAMPQLIAGIIDELPHRFFCHYTKELEAVFSSAYTKTSLGTHYKMGLLEY